MTCHSTSRLCSVASSRADPACLQTIVIVPVFCACMIASMGAIAGMDRIRMSQTCTDRLTEGIEPMQFSSLYSVNSNKESL